MKNIQDCFVTEVDLFMNILTFYPVFCIVVTKTWRNAALTVCYEYFMKFINIHSLSADQNQILRRFVNCFLKAYAPHDLIKV